MQSYPSSISSATHVSYFAFPDLSGIIFCSLPFATKLYLYLIEMIFTIRQLSRSLPKDYNDAQPSRLCTKHPIGIAAVKSRRPGTN